MTALAIHDMITLLGHLMREAFVNSQALPPSRQKQLASVRTIQLLYDRMGVTLHLKSEWTIRSSLIIT